MPPRVTIARVARRARVSKMTVSRVINDRPYVSPAVRARVQAVVEQLGYVPSARARSLAVGRSNVICMLVPDIVSEWIMPLLLGVGEAAAGLGFQMLLRTTGRGETYTSDAPDLLAGSDLADGVIVASWRVPTAFAQKAVRRGEPIVLLDGFSRPRDVPWVSSADRAGACAMVAYLAGLGHRRIAFIGGGREPYLARQRLAGFREGLRDAHLTLEPGLVRQGNFTRESGYACAGELLALEEPPTAIFAANDPMAVGALQAAHDRHWRLPDQLSVVGFDDTLAAEVYPSLTTVRRDYKEMGRTAMRLLAAYVGGNAPDRVPHVDIPTQLIVRQSARAPEA